MVAGDIVYFPYKGGFIRYKIRKVMEDTLLVLTYKGDVMKCVPVDDILTTDQFTKIYKNEKIYE